MENKIALQTKNGVPTASSKQVAEDFERKHCDILAAIRNLVTENSVTKPFFISSTYESRGKKYPEYLLTRDGFTLLVMGFTGAKALEWKLKYIEAFNLMEKQITTSTPSFENLSPQLQLLISIETRQKQQDTAILDANKRIDSISEIVALSTASWRADAHKIIAKIARKLGGFDNLKDINSEINRLVDERGGVLLETRLTNKRRRMADEGICKSKRDKLTKLDVIAEDKKLVEIYVAIVKELAVKNGVADGVAA